MKTYVPIFAIVAVALVAFAAELRPIPYADNLRDAVSKPSDQQDDFIKGEAAKLAKSQVPAADGAAKLALGAFLKKPGVDARETWRVTGLYRIGRDVTDFAKAGDLVWEIHISRMGSGVSGVVWVSNTTKSAKVLFPVDPGRRPCAASNGGGSSRSQSARLVAAVAELTKDRKW